MNTKRPALTGHEPERTGLTADSLQQSVLDNLTCRQGCFPEIATPHDWYMALAYSVRDRMLTRWVRTVQTYAESDVKVVCYLSAEFLMGPQLGNNLVNLGVEDKTIVLWLSDNAAAPTQVRPRHALVSTVRSGASSATPWKARSAPSA